LYVVWYNIFTVYLPLDNPVLVKDYVKLAGAIVLYVNPEASSGMLHTIISYNTSMQCNII